MDDSVSRPPALSLLAWPLLCFALAASPLAHALYKVQGPDGKITYTDRPPGNHEKATSVASGSDTASGAANLPLELRQVAARFPVTLYVLSNECKTCDNARNLLKQRGIPFNERLVATAADTDALQSLTGGKEAPVLIIGQQVNRGFSPDVWTQYLDVAGYPRESRLPANYQYPPPQPLTEPKATTDATLPPSSAAASRRQPPPPRPAASAPASTPGEIRF